MKILFPGLVVALSVALSPPCAAQDQQPDTGRPDRPRIGLVLSGGGARGAAHVGVLKVLEELRIPIHAVAANSMGSIVGGGYAYGYSPEGIQAILDSIDWSQALSDRGLRTDLVFRRKQDDLNFLIDLTFGFRDWKIVLPKGVVQGQTVGNILRAAAREAHEMPSFDDLPIPFRAVATAIGTGEQVILDKGSLPQAMSASMAIPGVFAPVEIDGVELVDGMVVNNIPIDIGKAMNVDVIIAVDIGTPLLKPEEIKTLLNVTGQMVSILMQRNVDERIAMLTDEDVLIRPDLGNISSTSFDRIDEGIEIGFQAARAMTDTLSKFSVSEEEYAEYLESQRRPATELPIIDRLILDNRSNLDDAVITRRMDTVEGDRLDADTLQGDIDRVYGMDEFQRVTYEIERTESGETHLHFIVIPKPWGPSYFRVGLNVEDDFSGDADYNFRVNFTARLLNSLGAEWRNDAQIGKRMGYATEFYQPLDPTARFFVAPQFSYIDLPVNQFQDGVKVAEVDAQIAEIGADVGAHLGEWAEIRVGYRRPWGNISYDFSTTPQQGFNFDDAVLRASLAIDTLDNPNFPSHGAAANLEYLKSLTDWGADDDYQRFEVRGGYAYTFGRVTVIPVASYGTTAEGTLPVYRQNALGGFLSLSGFRQDELTGQHQVSGRVISYIQLAGKRSALFGMPIYLGGSIETGSVTNNRNDLFDELIMAGSGFLGVDSPVGPIYVGYGLAEGGNDSAYFFIGRTF